MKTIASLLLVCWCFNSPGQTNSAPAETKPDSPPDSQTQTPSAKPEPLAPPAQTIHLAALTLESPRLDPEDSWLRDISVSGTPEASDPLALNTTERVMLRYYQRLEAAGYLTPPPLPSDNLYVRSLNAIFTAEPVRIGRASVAFTPITAIKRKNPLALLNPIVLNIGW